MTPPIAIILHGASGRMGQAVLRIASEHAGVCIGAAIVRAGSALEGDRIDADGVGSADLVYATHAPAAIAADVVLDFSGAEAFDAALALALDRDIAFVSGSTGLSDRQRAALADAAARIPVLWAANFSLGVVVLAHLVSQAARLLPQWDCDIVEAHHRHKRDAPSGTALMLGRAVTHARGGDAQVAATDRNGPRTPGDIGYAVVRGGDVVGEHQVLLIGDGERIEIGHRAGNRDIFARGALAAAVWIAGRPAGAYAMTDVLGLD